MNEILSPMYCYSTKSKTNPEIININGIEVTVFDNGVYKIPRVREHCRSQSIYRYLINEGFIVSHYSL